MTAPKHLLFSEGHVWIDVQGNRAMLGLSDYGQELAGSIVYIGLPETGETLHKGDLFVFIEAALPEESELELSIPVSGVVTNVNRAVSEMPGSLNLNPYGSGWLVSLELSDPSELEGLLPADEYERSYPVFPEDDEGDDG
ncbi:glycine cleavage system protein H [Paenibacillus sp. MBLB4367]|uniref:glycine cleavage system protein H n=1 Tax=Paenibacillus sp. MBLB4367 TaxID=3384767 RepID=UPI0039080172